MEPNRNPAWRNAVDQPVQYFRYFLEMYFFGVVKILPIVNPFSTIPLLLALTPGGTPERRAREARRASTYAAIILALLPMTYRGTSRPPRAGRSIVGDIQFGLGYARRHPALLWLMLTSFCVTGLAAPVVTNLGPVWTSRVLGLSATGVGLLATTWGIGAMVGSIAMTNVGHFRGKGWLFLGAAAAFDCFVIGFGYSRLIPVSALLNLGLGAMLTVTAVSATSLTQRLIPNEVQGRVMSIFMLSAGLAQLLTLPIGGLAQWATFELTMPVIGWFSLTCVVLIGLLQPAVRRAGRLAEAVEIVEVAR